jgi:HPt (histidine-containing phosphotransfer) domain-containing protein
MTANAFSSDRDACFAAGMNDFVSKPVNRDKLFGVIEQWSAAASGPPRRVQSETPATSDLIDRDQLEALREELGDDIVGELMKSFWASAGELIAQIEAAVGADDRAAADDLTHRLKGSAATLSFGAVAETCERLRRSLLSPDQTDAGELLSALLKTLRQSEDLARSVWVQPPRAAA